MNKTIIWATDGSEDAVRALPTALELARDGKLIVVHADERLAGRPGNVPALADEDELQTGMRAKVRELKELGVAATFEVVHGTNRDPADLIAEAAANDSADMIVVGTRGHGRVAGMLLGSVTQRLLHVAPCPVVAVPPQVEAPTPAGAR